MDGDDAHGLGIAFEAKFFRFYIGFFRGDLAFDPSHQLSRAEPPVARFCMDELCGMQKVCHEPFSIWPREDPGMDRIALLCLLPLHEPAEKRDEASGGPELVPFSEPLDPLIPDLFIFLEAGDHGGIHAQQGGAEGGAQLSIVRGVRDGLEPEVELVELGGVEDVAASADDAWNVDVPQRLLYITCLRTRPDQHGDVGRPYLPSIQEGVFLEQ